MSTIAGANGEIVGEYDGDGNVSNPIFLFDVQNWEVPSLPEGTDPGIKDSVVELYIQQFAIGCPNSFGL